MQMRSPLWTLNIKKPSTCVVLENYFVFTTPLHFWVKFQSEENCKQWNACNIFEKLMKIIILRKNFNEWVC